MKTNFSAGGLILAAVLYTAQAGAANFSSVYAFGDSLTDSGKSTSSVWSIYNFLNGYPGPINPHGKCDSFHPCPPYYDGRYSNGKAAVELLANGVLAGGSTAGNFFNFAVSGATTGIGNYGDDGSQAHPGNRYAPLPPLPGIAQQISFFQSYYSQSVAPNALYFLWGGANDYLTDVYIPLATNPSLNPNNVAQTAAQTAATNVANYAAALASFGAQSILVPNLPDLGLTPFVTAQGSNVINPAHEYSVIFNQTLSALLAGVDAQFANTDVIKFDTFGFFNTIVANPAAFGFSDAVSACVVAGVACANPGAHVFWDDFHPTALMHALVADAMVSQVPVPGAVWLFVSGLIVVFYRKNYRICSRHGC